MDKQSAKGTMLAREEGRSIDNEEVADNQDESSITSHQESNSNTHKTSENERQWLSSLEKSGGYPANGSSEKTKFQWVPEMLREIESKISFYEPLVVAIVPFHCRKSKLQSMEKHKKLLANQFADQDSIKERPWGVFPWVSTNSVSLDELYRKVKDVMPDVRECYAEDLIKDYSDEEFAQMMFLDGCFILRYINCIVTGNYKKLQMKSHDIALIRRDLFLLENQLPFEVLQVLMNCKFRNDEGLKMIKKFISTAHAKPPRYGFIQSINDFFLDFFEGIPFSAETIHGNREGPSLIKQERMKPRFPAHLLDLLKRQIIDPWELTKDGYYRTGDWYTNRSAMELRRSGIDFGRGKSHRLSDIKFNAYHCSALLTLPTINIDGSTKSEFLNLVAYEACADTPDDFGVTSYLCFMSSLIDNDEDVKELRSKGILRNFFGTNQEVANLFKEIARDLVPNPHAFVDVKDKIETQCSSKGKAWIAELKSTHFTSPWTFLAFIAAVFVISLQVAGIVLSAFQTYYAAHDKKKS